MAGCVKCGSVECEERDGVACKARAEFKGAHDMIQSGMKKIAAELAKAAEEGRFVTSITVALMTDGGIRMLIPDGSEITQIVGLVEIGKASAIDRFRMMQQQARGAPPAPDPLAQKIMRGH